MTEDLLKPLTQLQHTTDKCGQSHLRAIINQATGDSLSGNLLKILNKIYFNHKFH